MTPLILIGNTTQISLLESTYNVFHFMHENGISFNNYIGNPLISTLQSKCHLV